MISRRGFLATTNAVVVSVGSVSISKAEPAFDDNHPLIRNARAFCKEQQERIRRTSRNVQKDTFYDSLFEINQLLVKNHGSTLFLGQDFRFLRGWTVEPPLTTYNMFDYAYDGLPPGYESYEDFRNDVARFVAEDISLAYAKMVEDYRQHGFRVHHCVPITVTEKNWVSIDPETFYPVVNFRTRIGLTKI